MSQHTRRVVDDTLRRDTPDMMLLRGIIKSPARIVLDMTGDVARMTTCLENRLIKKALPPIIMSTMTSNTTAVMNTPFSRYTTCVHTCDATVVVSVVRSSLPIILDVKTGELSEE